MKMNTYKSFKGIGGTRTVVRVGAGGSFALAMLNLLWIPIKLCFILIWYGLKWMCIAVWYCTKWTCIGMVKLCKWSFKGVAKFTKWMFKTGKKTVLKIKERRSTTSEM